MTAHTVQWVSPSPLWSKTLSAGLDTATLGEQMRQPVLLRFTQDKFMDELAQILAQQPSALDANLATPTTYRLPSPRETQPPQPSVLKLFQAAHGHFYLVAGSLTCRLPGLPDHDVNPAAKEKVSFVLRRIDSDGSEWAWGDEPMSPGSKTWSKVDPSAALSVASGEDLLPLFPVRYQSGEKLRRIYVGLVPTSNGENFKASATVSAQSLLAPASKDDPGAAPIDPRPSALTIKVTDPLRALAATRLTAPSDVTGPTQQQAIIEAETDELVHASRFLLVDFAQFLVTNLLDLWTALGQQISPGDSASAALYDALHDTLADTTTSTTWRQALIDAWTTAPTLYGDAGGNLPAALNLANSALTGDRLDALVNAVLLSRPASPGTGLVTSIQGDSTTPPQVPKLDPRGQWTYQIRCVYQRPLCGPLKPDQVSDPSPPFQIASFFDLDAPSRQIFISLPVNTGISDLRKLRKNVNFLISDQLRNQMNRVTNLKDALNGQFAGGGSLDLGLLCSFSIPIITICALIVLMIFIQLLNIVFWWLPFLRICFPIRLNSGSQ